MSIRHIELLSPFKGVFIELAKVPDPVFAQKMVGDGFAIDPLDNILYSPLAGKIKTIHRAKHALTIQSDFGFEVLIHIGLETVALGGAGFNYKVKEGDIVKAGDKICELDLDYIADKAAALITPVLITDLDEQDIHIEILPHGQVVELQAPILRVTLNRDNLTASRQDTSQQSTISELITIQNPHGIHARPAAQLNKIARNYPHHEILLIKGEQSGNVKSVVSLLSLSIEYQDQIQLLVKGENGQQIIDELRAELTAVDAETNDVPAANLIVEEKIQAETGKFHGIAASNGLAVAKLQQQASVQFKYEQTTVDVQAELTRLDQAINSIVSNLDRQIKELSEFEVTHKNILSAHQMILTDPELIDQARCYISSGNSAAAAWDKATTEACQKLTATGNALLIERQSDLIDVRDQILTILCGEENKVSPVYAEAVILVAENFTPSQVIAMKNEVKGLVSVYGGITSHVAILARAKGIPLLVGVPVELIKIITASKQTAQEMASAASADTGKIAILDAVNSAFLNVNPSQAELDQAIAAINVHKQQLKIAQEASSLAAITTDGYRIGCLANIGNLEEAKIGFANGAEGVGLFRTEFMFLETNQAPSEEVQLKKYTEINQLLGDKSFVIRTLDAGGDKKISYLNQSDEKNPMLGIRGIRLCLANREIFKTQLKAILQTKADNIKIMLPMISKLTEYRAAKQIFAEIKAELGIDAKIQLGIMVEVPSVAFISEAFAREVDFMSIGTNDLTQYVLAIDREQSELAKEADHLHPAVLTAIAATVRGAQKHNIEVSVCGLMASEKLAIPILIGLGIKNLSMTVNKIAENKAFIRTLSYAKCKQIAEHCLSLPTAIEIREYLNTSVALDIL